MRPWINLIEAAMTEAPIANWTVDPAFADRANDMERTRGNPHWSKVDRATITEPARIERVKHVFRNCPSKLNIMFIHLPPEMSAQTFQDAGAVQPPFLRRLGDATVAAVARWMEPDAINFVLTNNRSEGAVSLASGWMLAHRLGHALPKEHLKAVTEDDLTDILTTCYTASPSEQSDTTAGYRELALEIATFRAGRERKLSTFNEYYVEMVAQEIIQGAVRFKTAPEMAGAWRLHDRATADAKLKKLEHWVNDIIDEMMHSATGKLFTD